MIDLDDALGSLTDVAARFDEPLEVIVARARRRTRRRRAVRAIFALAVVAAGIVGIGVAGRSKSPSVSVQPATGVIARAAAIAAARALDAHLPPSAIVRAKLINFDDYIFAANGGVAPLQPVRLQPAEIAVSTKSSFWLIYVQAPNTIALGHGPPAPWALVFLDSTNGKVAYRVSESRPDWPSWEILPDRAGPGDPATFCARARETLRANSDVPNMSAQQGFLRSAVQVEYLLAVAPPQVRDDLTTMRTFLKALILNSRSPVSYNDQDAAIINVDDAARSQCHIEIGKGLSIFGFTSQSSSPARTATTAP